MKAKLRYLDEANRLIKSYQEGFKLTKNQMHILNRTAHENGQILNNVVHMSWFAHSVAEEIRKLDIEYVIGKK